MPIDPILIEAHERIVNSYHPTEKGKVDYQLTKFYEDGDMPLISPLAAIPLMPASWSSTDDGDGWQWGRFILIFQKEPIESGMILSNDKEKVIAMKYPCCMTIFYQPKHNPYFPSIQPILVLCIEQCIRGLGIPRLQNPLFFGMYYNGGLKHANFGEYDKQIDSYEIKECFFTFISKYLNLSGQPERIGDLKKTRAFFIACINGATATTKKTAPSAPTSTNTDLNEFRDKWFGFMGGKLNKEEAEKFIESMKSKLNKIEMTKDYPLMNIASLPSMPIPFSSEDEGECWSWGKYLCLFQKKPEPIYKVFRNISKEVPDLIIYHYCLTILLKEVCIETSGIYPLMVIAIEQLSIGATNEENPCFLTIHSKEKREYVGKYIKNLHPEQVLTQFFDIAKSRLDLEGEPEYIGTFTENFPNGVNSFKNKKS